MAVQDLDEALAFYRAVLGVGAGATVVADGADVATIALGQTDIELLAPREPASPIARFLERRGPGIHHICYRVADLDEALRRCREAGYRTVDQAPRPGAYGRRIAFLHPKATAGILIELTE